MTPQPSTHELEMLRQRVADLEILEGTCRNAEERLRAVNECLIGLGNDADENMARLTALTGELLGATASIYNRLEGDELIATGQWHTPPDFKKVDQAEGHLCYHVISKNDERIVLIRNLAASPFAATDPNIHAYGLATYVGHVVRWGSVPIGSLCAVFQQDYLPSTDDERFLGIMAASIGSEERRRRDRNALKESESRFRRLLQDIPNIAVQGYGPDGTTRYWNHASELLYGYTAQEAIGKNLIDLIIPPEMRHEVETAIRHMAESGQPIPASELSLMRKDGSRVAVFSSHAIVQAPGADQELFCIDIDLTELKAAEAGFRMSEEKHRRLHQSMRDAFVSVDMEGRIRDCNESYLVLTGYLPEELHALTYKDITPEKWHAMEEAIVKKQILTRGYSDIYEKEYRRKDGTVFPVELRTILLRDDTNVPVSMWAIVRDISDRKQAEKALQESEERYRAVFENHAAVKLLIDPGTGAVIEANDAAAEYYGWSRKQLQQMRIQEINLLPPEDVAKEMHKACTGEKDHFEFRHRRADGSIRDIEVFSSKIRMKGKDFLHSIVHDITDRKKMEKAIQESEERFRLLAENAKDTIWTMDMDLRYTYMSPYVKHILDYSPEEYMAKPLSEIMTPSSLEMCLQILAFELEIEKREDKDLLRSRTVELEHVHRNGHIVPVEIKMTFLRNAAGQATGILGYTREIAERKEAEKTLRASEAKYRFLTEMMNDIVWTMNMNLEMVYVSPSVEKALGFSPEEHLARSIREQVTPESMSLIEEIVAREILIEQEGKADPERTLVVQLEYNHKDGGTRWFEHVIGGIRNDQGMLTGIHGVARDITERKAAEKALHESEQRMRLVLEGTEQGFWEFDLLSKRVNYSDNWHKILGYSHDEAIFDYDWWMSQIHPASKPVFEKALLDYMAGHTGYLEWEYQIRDKSGEWQWIQALGIFTDTDGSGFPVRMIGTHRNITERKRMEEDLLRSHKLESLGILAGGIAHDFNNLMAIVQGYIDLALLEIPPGHLSHRRLLTAMQGVEQTKDLTSRLITFSRGGGPVRQISDLAEMVRKAVLKTIKGTEIEVKFHFAENLWAAEVDELQMKEVFYNLTKNAMEAIGKGGKLTIEAENAMIGAGVVPDLREGSYIRIIFTDEGRGIPEDHLAKIFDPYFTTKGMGAAKGMGLGLSVCHSVMNKHGGKITVKSQLGAGTSFSLYLPAPTDISKIEEVQTLSPPLKTRVLIMDDEPHICDIERAYLERMGHEVTVTGEGKEAIDAYASAIRTGMPFDLVLLDLTVRQGMGGQLAMEGLMKIDPAVKAIIASGYVDDPVIQNYFDYGFQGALKKPFTREEIESLIKRLLPE